ncbi:MAG TPA: sugar-binding protein, partial [Polyangiaceae bacterium]|nr:sugar-binding protein [Polyangiaceae bacterium]
MRIASRFQRRRGPGRPLGPVLAACAWGLAFSFGCFFELDDLVIPPAGGSGGGGVGGLSGIGGGSPPGGDGGAGEGGGGAPSVICGSGTKDCGAGCVPFDVSNGCGSLGCTPCAQPPHATLSCNTDTGACQIDACESGYADCDGDGSAYTGEVAGNGCEYSFGPGGEVRPAPDLLEVPRADIDIGDSGRDDWSGVPAYPLIEACTNCFDNTMPEVTARNEVPSRRDLDAYFRVAWDNDFLYVLGDVFDSTLFQGGDVLSQADGRCQGGALCEDAFTVFIDGHNNRTVQSGYGNDDKRVFLSLSGKKFRVSGQPIGSGEVDLKVTQHAPACYRIEAQYVWSYVVDVQGGQTLPGLFPPEPGFEYGFDLSINDWDLSVSDNTPQRETELFW